jgi:molybdate transport system substrate-binding protein
MAIEPAAGAPITGISSMATRRVLAELAGAYALATGQRVTIESVGGVDATRRVRDGEAFDFVVLAGSAIESLAAAGRVDARSRVDVARSGVAIAVAAGARRPDIGSEAAVRDAVRAARSIGTSSGPSGAHLARLLERWGIAEAVAPRLVQAPPGVPVGALVARGDTELGFQQSSEMIDVPGIDIVGMLPPEIQEVTVFAGAVCSASARHEAAAALLAYLASPDASAAKRRHGMESA